jgi:hypothetical protein
MGVTKEKNAPEVGFSLCGLAFSGELRAKANSLL